MQYFIYILASRKNTTLYIGMTNNIVRRVYEHRNGVLDGFSKNYSTHKLVYYEIFGSPEAAIVREKQLKGGSRRKKDMLIEKANPEWKDLYESLLR